MNEAAASRENERLRAAIECVLPFLSDGHACLDCGYAPNHRPDCAFVALRSAVAAREGDDDA